VIVEVSKTDCVELGSFRELSTLLRLGILKNCSELVDARRQRKEKDEKRRSQTQLLYQSESPSSGWKIPNSFSPAAILESLSAVANPATPL
jgi:hypothetical protein